MIQLALPTLVGVVTFLSIGYLVLTAWALLSAWANGHFSG